MKNNINEPLNCLAIIPANKAVVEIKETYLGGGVWRSVGYVNGKPTCSCSSKDRSFNLAATKEDLADGGYYVNVGAKQLAPVGSTIGKLSTVVQQLHAGTDKRTEIAA